MSNQLFSELNFISPPECQGQIVEISYAYDGENSQIVSRAFDTSDRTTSYAVTDVENLVGEFEPWNRSPQFADDVTWNAAG